MKEGSADQGKWRVRVVPQGVVTTKELAKIMEQNCTVKSSDINAVLRELAETMKTSLLDGNRVVLDGLGAFKVTLKCTGTEKKEDFKIEGTSAQVHSRHRDGSRQEACEDVPQWSQGKGNPSERQPHWRQGLIKSWELLRVRDWKVGIVPTSTNNGKGWP